MAFSWTAQFFPIKSERWNIFPSKEVAFYLGNDNFSNAVDEKTWKISPHILHAGLWGH